MENEELVSKAYSPNGKNAFKLSFVSDNLSHLLGEILTVIDASLEGDKNKAVKDLIREKVGKKQDWFCEAAWKDIPQGSQQGGQGGPLGAGYKPHSEWETGVVTLVE